METLTTILSILSIIATITSGLLGYIIKNQNQRLRFLEVHFMPKQDIRQLIEDKIGGIHSDLKDIKAKIDKLFDIYINEKR